MLKHTLFLQLCNTNYTKSKAKSAVLPDAHSSLTKFFSL